MAFWPKKSGATSENPFRALNPAPFDKGARIEPAGCRVAASRRERINRVRRNGRPTNRSRQ